MVLIPSLVTPASALLDLSAHQTETHHETRHGIDAQYVAEALDGQLGAHSPSRDSYLPIEIPALGGQVPPRKDSNGVASAAESVGSVVYSSLPDAEPIDSVPPSFHLRSLTAADTCALIDAAYEQCTQYRPITFHVPLGNIGRRFITTLSSYYSCFGDCGSYRQSAFKIAAVFQALLLQKPKTDSTGFAKLRERRLGQWASGDLANLMREAGTIQDCKRLESDPKKPRWC